MFMKTTIKKARTRKTNKEQLSIVIMAGGGGTRLWPVSRQDKPKQFLDLGSGKTLLEMAWDRASALTDAKNIYVATTLEYADQVRALLNKVREENMMYEPERRDTGPAFAAAATYLENLGRGDVPTIFMWSDHVFTNEAELLEDLRKIPKILSEYPDSVVIAGHNPTFAETGLGYIEAGSRLPGHKDVYRVKSFKEKPDQKTAEKYLAAGNYFWNMAYVSVRPSYLLSELKKHVPDLMEQIEACREAIIKSDQRKYAKAYSMCTPISIDYALLEKTSPIIAVTGDYGWSDVGNWGAVKDVFGVRGDHVPKGHHVHVGASGNYVYNATDKMCSLVGMKDTIVVITDDAILITNKDSAHKVKDIVQKLKTDNQKKYL